MLNELKKFVKKEYLLITLVIIFLIVYNKWIFNWGIITNGDWPYAVKEAVIDHYLGFLNTWRGNTGFGGLVLDLGQAPTYIIYGLFAKFLGWNYNISERIVHLLPAAIIASLSSYFLFKEYFKSNLPAFVGSIVYSYNTYFLFSNSGHLTLMAAYAIAPILFYLIKKTFETNQNKYVALSAITGFIISAYEPRGFYVIALILCLYALFLYFLGEEKYISKNSNSFAIKFILIMFLIFLMNFFWILSLMKSNSLTGNALLDRDLFGSMFWKFPYSITLHHPWWSGESITSFINQKIPIFFWLIPLFAFLGLILNRKNRLIIFFGLIALIGILISKQIDQPFSGVYTWLYSNLPGFKAFREASKFYFFIVISYSVLIAGFADWINKNLHKTRIDKIIKFILITLIIGLFLFNTLSIINQKMGRTFVQREIPEDYLILNDYISSQEEYFRTLWIPKDSRWGTYTDNHPKISNIETVEGDLKELTDYRLYGADWPAKYKVIDIYNKNYSSNLLDVSSIKYVIIPLRDTKNDDDFFIDYGNSTQFYIDTLDNLNYLTEIEVGTEEVKVYENEGYLDHIYISSINQSLKDLDKSKISNVRYKQIDSTSYKIYFNSTEPFYLYFSEAYNSNWKLASKDFKWYSGFKNKNYVFNEAHFKSYGFLNGWQIDPSELNKNADGTYELTIYFQPQSYFYLGLIISLITLILCIIYLIWDWKMKSKL
ncbi:MAG: hypothetical protein WC979_08140 [Candidatus Pacearchaeota archaeon]|jgi:hypothetical protein